MSPLSTQCLAFAQYAVLSSGPQQVILLILASANLSFRLHLKYDLL